MKEADMWKYSMCLLFCCPAYDKKAATSLSEACSMQSYIPHRRDVTAGY